MAHPRDLAVTIVALVDEAQPGWVEAHLTDAFGRRHVFIEKVPILTAEPLDAQSIYPRAGAIRCFLENDRVHEDLHVFDVDTNDPDSVASTEDVTKFAVLKEQLTLR